MPGNSRKKQRDPIPERFTSMAEAAEFWDTHDLADYWDATTEVDFEVDLKRRLLPRQADGAAGPGLGRPHLTTELNSRGPADSLCPGLEISSPSSGTRRRQRGPSGPFGGSP